MRHGTNGVRRHRKKSRTICRRTTILGPIARTEVAKLECPDCDLGEIEINGRLMACPTCGGTGDVREGDLATAV